MPLSNAEDELLVYNYLGLPYQISPGVWASLHPRDDKTILAISAQHDVFRTLSATQLLSCSQFGPRYLCAKDNILRTGNNLPVPGADACLFALFKRKYDDAIKACEVRLFKNPSYVVQTANSKFTIFSTEPHEGMITCRNSSTGTPFSAGDRVDLDLLPGCTARTHDFVFSASTHVDLGIEYTSYAWPHGQQPWLSLNETHLASILQQHEDLNTSPYTRSEAMKAIVVRAGQLENDEFARRHGLPFGATATHHAGATGTIIIILVIVAAIICIWFCYTRCCRRAEERAVDGVRPNQPQQFNFGGFGPLGGLGGVADRLYGGVQGGFQRAATYANLQRTDPIAAAEQRAEHEALMEMHRRDAATAHADIHRRSGPSSSSEPTPSTSSGIKKSKTYPFSPDDLPKDPSPDYSN